MYLRDNESITYDTGSYNKKIFKLLKSSKDLDLNKRDITTFQLFRSTVTRPLLINRKDSINKFRTIYSNVMKKNIAAYGLMTDEQNTRSLFYESLYDEAYEQKLDDIIWAIANHKKIIIHSLSGDATSIPKKIKTPFIFKPLYLIHHRGNYFLMGYHKTYQQFFSLDISKLGKLELTTVYQPLINWTNFQKQFDFYVNAGIQRYCAFG